MALWHFEFQLVEPCDTAVLDEDRGGHFVKGAALSKLQAELRSVLKESRGWTESILVYGEWEASHVGVFMASEGAEVNCRAAMTNDGPVVFLRTVFAIASRCGLEVTVPDHGIIRNCAHLIELAMASSAARFCRDPRGFIDNIKP